MKEGSSAPLEALHDGDGVGKLRVSFDEIGLLVGSNGVLELEHEDVLHGASHCDRLARTVV